MKGGPVVYVCTDEHEQVKSFVGALPSQVQRSAGKRYRAAQVLAVPSVPFACEQGFKAIKGGVRCPSGKCRSG